MSLSGKIAKGTVCIAITCVAIVVWLVYKHKAAEQTLNETVRTYRIRAEQGNARAQFSLGVSYMLGRGAPQDYAEAIVWLRKSANQGYAKAEYDLAAMYAQGEGVPQNYAEAIHWSREAADQGDPKAQVGLAVSYLRGQGVARDYTEAVRWFLKAADQGEPAGQYGLGLMYQNGEGVRQDYTKAVRWYRKAADQGNPGAQYALGFMYYKGLGVPQDYAAAAHCYGQAADQGEPRARSALHSMICTDALVQLRRWTSIATIALALPILLVPRSCWQRATWLPWALCSAACGTALLHQLQLSAVSRALLSNLGPLRAVSPGFGPGLLILLFGCGFSGCALLAFQAAVRTSRRQIPLRHATIVSREERRNGI